MAVRLVPMGRYVTPDEPIWVMRSVRLLDAIAAKHWGEIPQTGHPGVTTMVLGALGVRLTMLFDPTAAAEHLTWIRNMAWLAPENSAAFPHLAYFLPAGRVLVALSNAAGIIIATLVARPRLGNKATKLLTILLALDPFFAGHAGLLHTDALQATFALIAVLLALPRQTSHPTTKQVRDKITLLGIALFLALAGITKTLGLLIAPGLALAILILDQKPWKQRILRICMLAIATAVLTLGLTPSSWHDPIGTVQSLVAAVSYHEGIGVRGTFFAGETVTDPGILFYPVVLLFRFTPAVLIGLLLGIKASKKPGIRHYPIWFLLPSLSYLAILMLATKKFDRYALTVIPLFTAIAACGWKTKLRQQWYAVFLGSLLLPWAMVAPLPLLYADPLLGGPWSAQSIIPLGWGEGSGLAASKLTHQLDNPTEKTLLSLNVPGAAPFFPGATHAWDEDIALCADALIWGNSELPQGLGYKEIDRIYAAGLHLATITLRDPVYPKQYPLLFSGPMPGAPAEAVVPPLDQAGIRDWLSQRYPKNKDFVWVQAPECHPITEKHLNTLLLGKQADEEAAAECIPRGDSSPGGEAAGLSLQQCRFVRALTAPEAYQARFDGTLDLSGTTWPATISAPEALPLRLRWYPRTPQSNHTIYLTLEDTSGKIWAEGGNLLVDDRIWPASVWETDEPISTNAYIPLPLSLAPATYTITLSLFDDTGRRLGLSYPDGTFGGTHLPLGQVVIEPPPYPASELGLPIQLQIASEGLKLIGATPPPKEIWAGDELPFKLGWERTAGTTTDNIYWSLICDNQIYDGGDLRLSPGTSDVWPAAHRYTLLYAPRTSPLLPNAECTLAISATHTGPITVGPINIQARSRQFELPHPPELALNTRVGNFAHLVGADLTQDHLTAETSLPLTLYWKAQATADVNYTVFVHLIGPDGKIWAQSDSEPALGTAPTSSWIKGQVISDTHSLNLPSEAPKGSYTLFVGLYDVESGGRIPLYDSTGARLIDDRVPVGEFVYP